MQVKSIAECSKGRILQYFWPSYKLPFVIKIYVLSIFEWQFYTWFTVYHTGPNKHTCSYKCKIGPTCICLFFHFLNFKYSVVHFICIGYRSYITFIKELSGNECSEWTTLFLHNCNMWAMSYLLFSPPIFWLLLWKWSHWPLNRFTQWFYLIDSTNIDKICD